MVADERIETYINSLGGDFPDYLLEIEKEALSEHVPIIRKSMQEIMKYLMITKKPERILEIGTAVGFSALLMREYAKNAKIITIEKVPKRIEKAKENLKKYDKNNSIILIEEDAITALKSLNQTFDFVFLDAAKGQYMNFMDDILKLVDKGGIIVSDNVLQDGDIVQSRYAVTRRNRTIHSRMREYLYYLTHCDELTTIVLPVGDGLTISTKIS